MKLENKMKITNIAEFKRALQWAKDNDKLVYCYYHPDNNNLTPAKVANVRSKTFSLWREKKDGVRESYCDWPTKNMCTFENNRITIMDYNYSKRDNNQPIESLPIVPLLTYWIEE